MLVYIAGLLSAITYRQTETARPSRTLHSRLAFCIDRKQVYSKYGKHGNYTAVWLSCINYRQTETARLESWFTQQAGMGNIAITQQSGFLAFVTDRQKLQGSKQVQTVTTLIAKRIQTVRDSSLF